jgi:hypothetical protein
MPIPRSIVKHPFSLVQSIAQARQAHGSSRKAGSGGTNKQKKGEASKKKKKTRTTYLQYDLKDAEQFALCDAMRYADLMDPHVIRAKYATDTFELSKSDARLRLSSMIWH